MKLIKSGALAIGSNVIIADLHLGLFRFHDPVLIERVAKLAEKFETVIIAGDLKHLGKRSLTKEFIEKISGLAELIVIRGNHDVGVDYRLENSRGIRLGKYGIFHGHAIPEERVLDAKCLIFAHAHPSVLLTDDVGGYKERAFLMGEVTINAERKRVVVLPAFNEICASTAVNIERPAGFAFRRWDYKEWDAVLLDGTVLKLSTL